MLNGPKQEGMQHIDQQDQRCDAEGAVEQKIPMFGFFAFRRPPECQENRENCQLLNIVNIQQIITRLEPVTLL